ncbi:hypothetical protein [Candidatus Amarolinea dominans]|uniref:hypothetical protein n=1 Tax=Candidatus Amarolinea dominans TaxID=3140696 RepID=UPI001D52DDE6|nr:hypothetical protein [Anaerolineae bacterium]
MQPLDDARQVSGRGEVGRRRCGQGKKDRLARAAWSSQVAQHPVIAQRGRRQQRDHRRGRGVRAGFNHGDAQGGQQGGQTRRGVLTINGCKGKHNVHASPLAPSPVVEKHAERGRPPAPLPRASSGGGVRHPSGPLPSGKHAGGPVVRRGVRV